MTYIFTPRLGDNLTIIVVGCGGTGSFVAEGLCRLLIPLPRASLVLVDGDRVEERNLLRQNFYPHEIGMPKAQALATRLSQTYKRPIGYMAQFLEALQHYQRLLMGAGLLVGCVDNAPARRAILSHCGYRVIWIDAGNGEHTGQVLVGNSRNPPYPFDEQGCCVALPYPSLQRPDIFEVAPQEPSLLMGESCAQGVLIGGQSPVINHAMSTLVLLCVHQLINGTLNWMAAYLDIQQGWLQFVPITVGPETKKKGGNKHV